MKNIIAMATIVLGGVAFLGACGNIENSAKIASNPAHNFGWLWQAELKCGNNTLDLGHYNLAQRPLTKHQFVIRDSEVVKALLNANAFENYNFDPAQKGEAIIAEEEISKGSDAQALMVENNFEINTLVSRQYKVFVNGNTVRLVVYKAWLVDADGKTITSYADAFGSKVKTGEEIMSHTFENCVRQ